VFDEELFVHSIESCCVVDQLGGKDSLVNFWFLNCQQFGWRSPDDEALGEFMRKNFWGLTSSKLILIRG
jgi:hypothetical protein